MDEYMRELYAAKVLVSKLVALLTCHFYWLARWEQTTKQY